MHAVDTLSTLVDDKPFPLHSPPQPRNADAHFMDEEPYT